MNIWNMLLWALAGFVSFLLNWLFGGEAGYHQAMGLASVMTSQAYVVLEVTWATIGNFNLSFAFLCLGITFVLWIIRLMVRLYLFIKILIPFVN